MCNLYQTTNLADLIAQAYPRNIGDVTDNEPWPNDVYPNPLARIIRPEGDHTALRTSL